MAKDKTKLVTLAVTVKVHDWMTKTEVAREVRCMINESCGYMTGKQVKGVYRQVDMFSATKVKSVSNNKLKAA
jgi:hypothetical protein